jgi:hypothetical protein
MKRQISPEAEGYLLEAKACKKVLKDLERIREKYRRGVEREQARRKAEFETVMEFTSEREIQEAYGWELINERQYDRYLQLFREGEAALENHAPTCVEIAHGILCRMTASVEMDIREWEFAALTPEQQCEKRKQAEENRLKWEEKIAEIRRRRGTIEAGTESPSADGD